MHRTMEPIAVLTPRAAANNGRTHSPGRSAEAIRKGGRVVIVRRASARSSPARDATRGMTSPARSRVTRAPILSFSSAMAKVVERHTDGRASMSTGSTPRPGSARPCVRRSRWHATPSALIAVNLCAMASRGCIARAESFLKTHVVHLANAIDLVRHGRTRDLGRVVRLYEFIE